MLFNLLFFQLLSVLFNISLFLHICTLDSIDIDSLSKDFGRIELHEKKTKNIIFLLLKQVIIIYLFIRQFFFQCFIYFSVILNAYFKDMNKINIYKVWTPIESDAKCFIVYIKSFILSFNHLEFPTHTHKLLKVIILYRKEYV